MDTGFEQEYLAELTETKEKPIFHFATIGAVYADGVSLIFDGQSTASQKHYKYNKSIVSMNPGDRVKIFPDSGTYVVEYVLGLPDYVWDVYEVNGSYRSITNSSPTSVIISASSRTYYATNYTFNSKTGVYTLTNPQSVVGNAYSVMNELRDHYWIVGSPSASSVYYGFISVTTYGDEIDPRTLYYSTGSSSRGDPTGETVFSDDPNAYPANGIQGDYWYVLQT